MNAEVARLLADEFLAAATAFLEANADETT
jgi:hypothetical protein